MGGAAAGARCFVDGLAPGERGIDGEEAFEREDGLFEEVEGEHGDDVGENKGEESADDVVIVAAGGVADLGAEAVVKRLEKDVVDVEAVADAAEPAERRPREDSAGKAGAENQGNSGSGGDAEAGKAEPELDWVDEIERSGGNAGPEIDDEAADEGVKGIFADEAVGAWLAACGVDAIAHGEGQSAAEGEGATLGKQEVVVQMVGAGTIEGEEGVDGNQEEFANSKKPDAEAKGVAAAVREEHDDGPEEIELLFDGQGPEMVERQRGGRRLEGVAGEVGEVLKEEDEDEQRPELAKVSAIENSDGSGGEQGKEVERKDTECAAGVEVTQAVVGVVRFPETAGDEEAGEGEEEDNS